MRFAVAKEFSDIPAGRCREHGEYSGERFREDFLVPKLKQSTPKDPLIVDLNGAEGYPSNFLKEAFGGLISKGYFTKKELEKIMVIEARSGWKLYEVLLWRHIDEAHEAGEFLQSRDAREAREARDARQAREVHEAREARKAR